MQENNVSNRGIFTPELIEMICPMTEQVKKDLANTMPENTATTADSDLKIKNKKIVRHLSNQNVIDYEKMDFSHL